MSIATIAEFKAYGKKADEPAGENNYQMFLDSASAIVVDYLGYEPAFATRADSLFGDGKIYLHFPAPIISMTSITVDGVSKTISDFLIDFNTITEKNGNPFGVGSLVVVVYTGGWLVIPAQVKHTELQIASLMAMEMGENIGTTGSTMDGGNSRTFISYTKFDKYLAKLAGISIKRLPRITK